MYVFINRGNYSGSYLGAAPSIRRVTINRDAAFDKLSIGDKIIVGTNDALDAAGDAIVGAASAALDPMIGGLCKAMPWAHDMALQIKENEILNQCLTYGAMFGSIPIIGTVLGILPVLVDIFSTCDFSAAMKAFSCRLVDQLDASIKILSVVSALGAISVIAAVPAGILAGATAILVIAKGFFEALCRGEAPSVGIFVQMFGKLLKLIGEFTNIEVLNEWAVKVDKLGTELSKKSDVLDKQMKEEEKKDARLALANVRKQRMQQLKEKAAAQILANTNVPPIRNTALDFAFIRNSINAKNVILKTNDIIFSPKRINQLKLRAKKLGIKSSVNSNPSNGATVPLIAGGIILGYLLLRSK